MLLFSSLLQGLQPVSTSAVGYIIPKVTWLHAVLPDVAPFQQMGKENRKLHGKINKSSPKKQNKHDSLCFPLNCKLCNLIWVAIFVCISSLPLTCDILEMNSVFKKGSGDKR